MLPSINLYDKKVADEIYQNELSPYIGNEGYWNAKQEYYAKNLLWFGQYMYINKKVLD